MDLVSFDGKHVRITDRWGETVSGLAHYGSSSFLEHAYGVNEDGILIGDILLYRSSIASIEEIVMHGTGELETAHMLLRRFCPEDAQILYRKFGADPGFSRYSGWNPYRTPQMAARTVQGYIDRYRDEHFYSWIMDLDGVLVGTIGAYDYQDDSIEVGFSVVPAWQGRGLATEALQKVLQYLTEQEGIRRVTAWCAAANIGSKRVLEKAGMQLVSIEKNGLAAAGTVYDRLIYAYRL